MTLPALFSGRLRVRLILMVVCAVLPPLAAVLYTAAEWRRHDIVEEQRYAVQLARHAAAIYERLIDESRDMLFSLAQLPVVARGEEPGVGEVLHAFLGQHLNHSNLGVIDPDGKLLVSARPLRHRRLRDRPR